MSGLLQRDDLSPRYTLFPREIFHRDEEDRRRRCRGHRRGGLTKYPAEKIRGTAGVVRELFGLASARLERGPLPRRQEVVDSNADFDRPDQQLFGWNRLTVGHHALQVRGDRFLRVRESLGFRVSLRVAAPQGRNEGVEAAVVFALEDHRVPMPGHESNSTPRRTAPHFIARQARTPPSTPLPRVRPSRNAESK